MKKHLTQFTRFIPATAISTSVLSWTKFGMWSMMAVLIMLNVFVRVSYPISVRIPDMLADAFVSAQQTMNTLPYGKYVSHAISKTQSSVLGDSTDEAQQGTTTQQKRKNLENSYTYWQSVVTEHPTYRDGYLMLASIAYMLNDPKAVQENLTRATQLDPNGDTLHRFEVLTKN